MSQKFVIEKYLDGQFGDSPNSPNFPSGKVSLRTVQSGQPVETAI